MLLNKLKNLYAILEFLLLGTNLKILPPECNQYQLLVCFRNTLTFHSAFQIS